VNDAIHTDGLTVTFKRDILSSVSPAEIRLVHAHLGDLLLKVLMQDEEE